MIPIPKSEIASFCKRWDIVKFSIFGSALSTNFSPDSDVDVLVAFAPGANVSLFEMVKMQDELQVIFSREVDLISEQGLEHSRNYLRKNLF